jgi:hypothetical protein
MLEVTLITNVSPGTLVPSISAQLVRGVFVFLNGPLEGANNFECLTIEGCVGGDWQGVHCLDCTHPALLVGGGLLTYWRVYVRGDSIDVPEVMLRSCSVLRVADTVSSHSAEYIQSPEEEARNVQFGSTLQTNEEVQVRSTGTHLACVSGEEERSCVVI